MSDNEELDQVPTLVDDLSDLGKTALSILRRIPSAKKALIKLTTGDGITGTGVKALSSRLKLYQTSNLITEAQKLADTTGQPLPQVFDGLARVYRVRSVFVADSSFLISSFSL